jgi:integrase
MVSYSTTKWGKAPLYTIQPERVGAWIASVQSKKDGMLSEKTRSHILETMRQVLNAGVEWGYLQKSPARPGAFRSPRKNSRVRPIQPFESWAEVERVAEACGSTSPFVRFVCATGLRCPGETNKLLWQEIDRQQKSIRVGSKTAAGHRTVPLSRQAIQSLSDLPRSLDGRVFTFNYHAWRKTTWPLALIACGLPHRTPYEMRHTFATLSLAQGASIDDVATVMGHDDIAITFRYYRKWIKASADRLRLTLDQIGEDEWQSSSTQTSSTTQTAQTGE